MKKKTVCGSLCLLLFFMCFFAFPTQTYAYDNKKNVLVIQSYNDGYKWSDDIMTGINSILNTSPLDLNVEVDYMDTLRNSGEEYGKILYDFYKYKYQNKRFDAVICCDDSAYNFVLKYQQEIFPKTPIVFCGVNYFDPEKIEGNKWITGIIENFDIEANLELILKLHPMTKNVYIINDKTMSGQAVNKRLQQIIQRNQYNLNFINLQGESIETILNAVKNPLPNSAALFLILFDDAHGHRFNYDEGPKLISENSIIPMYGDWEFSLGHGIIGGMLTSGYYQGKTAAEITLDILNGKKVTNIPVVDQNTNSYMFDYKEMERFHIQSSDIPSDSYIINRPTSQKKQILVLDSYHFDMKWTKDINSGIMSVIDPKKYDIYFEYMDTKRNYTNEYKEKIEDLLKYKLKNKKFDLIITVDNDAYDFVKRYHLKLFPSVPLVFCGLNYYSPDVIKDNLTTGVIESIDVKKTIDLALMQNPKAKHVVIINDTTLTGRANKKAVIDIIPAFKNKVDFVFYEDMNMTDIQDKVAKLDQKSVIYLLSFNKDKSNNIFSYEESADLISSKSAVPVYGAWDFYLDHGVIGGMLTNGKSQGQMVAAKALQILKGKKISEIPVSDTNTNKYIFDYKQLKKFNIDKKTLPAGSKIINEPDTFPIHKWYILSLIFILMSIILALAILYQRNKVTIKTSNETINELKNSAFFDFLTETLNRGAGISAINELIQISNETKSKFLICFMDLNYLKNVNDTFGHNEGDRYIVNAVNAVKAQLRKTDILFRFGGDEFIILFPELDIEIAQEILSRVNQNLKEHTEYEHSISFGFCYYDPENPKPIPELIDIADKEMYHAKNTYKKTKEQE